MRFQTNSNLSCTLPTLMKATAGKNINKQNIKIYLMLKLKKKKKSSSQRVKMFQDQKT